MPEEMRPRRLTPEELEERREAAKTAKEARAASRAQWIEDNPEAYAAEQAALEANRKLIKEAVANPPLPSEPEPE